jgi:AraC-like DNA-binding protein
MGSNLEYIRTGHGIPDSQLLGINSPDAFFFFRIQTFHLEEIPKQITRRPAPSHIHNVFHIVFFTEDSEKNFFMLKGRKTESEPGTLVMTAPEDSHSFSPLDPSRTVYHELTFSLENENGPFLGNWNQLMSYYSGHEDISIPTLTKLDSNMMHTLDKHFRELGVLLESHGGGNHMAALKKVLDILYLLKVDVFTEKDSGYKDNPLKNAKRYIEMHFQDDLDLKGLGLRFFMSPEHLCRKFKSVYGISPLKLAVELKISAAKNMLLHSEQSIKEISDSLGFSDVYAFSKSFRKNTGVPPGKFRKGIPEPISKVVRSKT